MSRSNGVKSAVAFSTYKYGSTVPLISPLSRGCIRLACLYAASSTHFTLMTQTDTSKLPTIIKEMGIASNANQVQLWSVIPFAVATPFTGE